MEFVSIASTSYEMGVKSNYTINVKLNHINKLTIASSIILNIPTMFQSRI